MDDQLSRHLVGIRFPGSSLVAMCEGSEESWTVGTWVLVDGLNGERAGIVVVAPGTWRGSPGVSPGRVLRALSSDEVAIPSSDGAVAPVVEVGPEIGSVGRARAPVKAGQASSTVSLGGEDERFRRLKLGLPRPGQRVKSGEGYCIVLAVDTVSRLVTCAMESDGSDIVVPAERLSLASSG